jgi:hypothetical protein
MNELLIGKIFELSTLILLSVEIKSDLLKLVIFSIIILVISLTKNKKAKEKT